jgi:hypothetical protein
VSRAKIKFFEEEVVNILDFINTTAKEIKLSSKTVMLGMHILMRAIDTGHCHPSESFDFILTAQLSLGLAIKFNESELRMTPDSKSGG